MIRFLVGLGLVGLGHEVTGLLQIVFLALIEQLDFLADGEKVLGFLVVAFVAMAPDAAALAEQVLALADHPADVIRYENHVGRVANLAASFVVLRGEDRPDPVFVIAVSFLDAGRGAPVSLVAGRAAEFLGIVHS